jgi:hypothetical protein
MRYRGGFYDKQQRRYSASARLSIWTSATRWIQSAGQSAPLREFIRELPRARAASDLPEELQPRGGV